MRKYAIDAELLPYCFRLPKLPKWIVPMLQKLLRMYGRTVLKDKRIESTTFGLENGVKGFLLKPKDSHTDKVMYAIHGGGFVFPHAPYHFRLAKEYALRLDAKVFLIDYRLAPQNKNPVAVEDCFMGYEFLLKNKEKLGIDMDSLVIGGDSAGAYLAVTTSLRMLEKYGTAPKGNVLLYPACDTGRDTESMKKYTDTPLCNSKDAQRYNAWFNNGEVISLLKEDLSKLPPTYIEIAEFDCLRDGGLAYAKQLSQSGVEVELHDVSATMHGFDMARKAKITRNCVDNRIRFISSHFGS